LMMYYGAADTSIAVAQGSLRELLDWLDANGERDFHLPADQVAAVTP
jgi:hypothetical protein